MAEAIVLSMEPAGGCREPRRIVQISAAQAQYLEQRGGRSHRGRGTFSRSVVLGRVLESHRLYQEFTDPRLTRGMPEEFHALVSAPPRALGAPELRDPEA
jgi:hypothetical protein